MKIKSTELFATVYNKIFRYIMNHIFTEYLLIGGRASIKSSFISICIVLLIRMNPTFNAVIVRKYKTSLRNSVFEQIVWAIKILHCEHLFKIPQSTKEAAPITYKKTGQKIIFVGSDDPEKIKGLKVAVGYFAILWIEEKSEFTQTDVTHLKASALRGGEKFYVFESYNPPSSPRNWCNTDARQDKKDRVVLHTTYLDIIKEHPEWLGGAIINEIEFMKKNNFRAYENVYLGKATGTGTNIFENVELRPITNEEINRFDFNYYGLDFGFYPDPLCYNGFSYNMQTKTLYIYDELKLYKHGNYEASEKLKEHLHDFYISLGFNERDVPDFMTDRITADSAEPKSISDFRAYGWNMRGAIKGKGSLEAGMKWLQTRAKIVIDPSRCPEAADEFSMYEYEIDKKTGEILSGFPDGQPDHSIAALRYGTEEIWRNKGI